MKKRASGSTNSKWDKYDVSTWSINVLSHDLSFDTLKKIIEEEPEKYDLYTLYKMFQNEFYTKSDKSLQLVNDFLECYKCQLLKFETGLPNAELKNMILDVNEPWELFNVFYLMYYCGIIIYKSDFIFVEWMKLHTDIPYTLKEMLEMIADFDKNEEFIQTAKEMSKLKKLYKDC